ncbi:MAG: hypothetical protein Q9202_003715 [Teloschistes flavicans]
MYFSGKYFTLALAFATGTLAVPQQYVRQTTTQPPSALSSGGSTTIPSECHMFKPYVAEVFLGAICSLHMNPLAPGKMPTINSECFGAGAQQTIVNHGHSYQPQETSLGGGNGYTFQQQTTQVATPTNNPYQGQQTTRGGGYQARPTTTSSASYEY